MHWLIAILGVSACLAEITAQNLQGKRFLLAFPPPVTPTKFNEKCTIIINTDKYAEVSLSYHKTTKHIEVDKVSYEYDINCTIRAPPGHNNKAILVESNEDVSVQVFVSGDFSGDAYLALPLKPVGAEYLLVTTPKSCSFGNSTVFTVAAEMDDTVVAVFAPYSDGYVLNSTIHLNRFDTYTYSSASMDITGWKVSSNLPVSVITGSSCFSAGCEYAAAYLFVPPIDEAGNRFIVPEINKEDSSDHDDDSGAFIRVISFSHGNDIQLPDESLRMILNTGEHFQYYISLNQVTRVECRERCVVILINECKGGIFMLYVTPLERRTDYTRFTGINSATDYAFKYNNSITVIAETQDVVVDIAPIRVWRAIPEWSYYEATMRVDAGGHTLHSPTGGKFVAFVYGVSLFSSHGIGSQIVYSALTSPTFMNETTHN